MNVERDYHIHRYIHRTAWSPQRQPIITAATAWLIVDGERNWGRPTSSSSDWRARHDGPGGIVHGLEDLIETRVTRPVRGGVIINELFRFVGQSRGRARLPSKGTDLSMICICSRRWPCSELLS